MLKIVAISCLFVLYHANCQSKYSSLPLSDQLFNANETLIIKSPSKRCDQAHSDCTVHYYFQNEAPNSIASAPVIDPFNFSRYLEEGSRSKILCTVIKGDPPFTIKWLKDGKPLLDSSEDGVSTIALDDYSVALVFSRVKLNNRGNYTCLVSNGVASTNHTAPAFVRARPRWTLEPMNSVGVTGKDVLIHCQADGFPDPVIQWKRASGDNLSSPFQLIQFDGRFRQWPNNTLEIKSTDKSDAGYYMCSASNGIGPGINTIIELQIRSPAHFKEEFKVETVRKGGLLVVRCEALGDKPLTIDWKKDGQVFKVSSDKRYSVIETITDYGVISEIRVGAADRRDSSLFTCTATNGYGTDKTNIQAIVQEKPDPPSKAVITKVESRDISLSWSPPYAGNSLILHYVIEYKEVTGDWKTDRKLLRVPGTETRATIGNLWPDTSYHLRILAENVLGTSEPGPVLHAITELEVPSEYPSDVRAEPFGSKSIKVKWRPPKSMRGRNRIKGYYVGYKPANPEKTFIFKTMEVDDQSGPYQLMLNNLTPLTRYIIIVKAFNRKGAGPASPEISVKTNDLDSPKAPRLEVLATGHNSISIKWDLSDPNSNILGYRLYIKEEDSSWTEYRIDGEFNSHVFGDLSCGRKYEIYVTGYNEAGAGQPSNLVKTKTHGSVPKAPSIASFIRTNGTVTNLLLKEWESGGCPIKDFKIQYKMDGSSGSNGLPSGTSLSSMNDWKQLTQTVSGDVKSLLLRDLIPDASYRIRIVARSDSGTTQAEYNFLTSTNRDYGSPPSEPGWSISDHDVAWINIILFPLIAVSVIIGCIVILVFGLRKKPLPRKPERVCSIKESISYSEELPMSEISVKQSRTNLYDKSNGLDVIGSLGGPLGSNTNGHGNVGKECLYCPSILTPNSDRCSGSLNCTQYSTNSVNTCTDDGFTPSTNHYGRAREEQTYEVPFLLTKPKTSHLSGRYSTTSSEHPYSYPCKFIRTSED
ncbi:Down syndrome cell adhesion molecule homolog [Tetranychus urticae]|uniref:Down syndrome cell adhesion molecule homolog n=1 Tax=Tetranychus urticae TaxID=32264 RepID=UPI00077BB473|nr:Down syndrome cell adhesion molecule homolog [Tetranychus urticae]